METTVKQKAQKYLNESKEALAQCDIEPVLALAQKILDVFRSGGKLLVFGNGGSCSDAEHLAAELVIRFEKERKPYKAIALSANTSVLTAGANDYGFDKVFARQIEAYAEKKDAVIAISTSGVSPNVLNAVQAAKETGCFTAALTGKDGGKLKDMVDLCILVKSKKTADIQICHIAYIHLLCYLIENI